MNAALQYPWQELAAMRPGGQMERNHFVRLDDAETYSNWRSGHQNRDIFASIGHFGKPDRASAYRYDLVLDCDAADLNVAHEETIRICEYLIKKRGIDQDSLEIFFSGCKGFHVIVPEVVFNTPEDPDVITLWRNLARHLSAECAPHLDLSIYQVSQLLRLSNSINSKSGLCKIPLEYKELIDYKLPYIQGMARQPRETDSMAMPTRSDKAAAWIREALEYVKRISSQQAQCKANPSGGWEFPPCMQALEAATLPDGIRHTAYFQYARYLATIGAAPDEIRRRLVTIDARHPIQDSRYIEHIARRAAKYAGFRTCPKTELAQFCNPSACPFERRRTTETPRKGPAPHTGSKVASCK